MRGRIWTKQEWETALKLQGLGHDRKYIALILGRSPDELRKKIHYESMTPSERETKRLRTNESRASRRKGAPRRVRAIPNVVSVPFDKTPESVLQERKSRLALEHANLTAEFFGDPKPGYSALDKKQGAFA